MKLKEICEMAPYHVKTEPSWKEYKGSSYKSMSALEREWTLIYSSFYLTIDDLSIDIFQNKETRNIIAGFKSIDPEINEEAFEVIFTLSFRTTSTLVKIPPDIKKSKILQVKKVVILRELKDQGLASFVYFLLVSKGWVILSDTSHYNGGVGLWKKMAKLAHLRDCEIKLIDEDEGYLKDDITGEELQYELSNIPDETIWSSDHDYRKQHVLLVLRAK